MANTKEQEKEFAKIRLIKWAIKYKSEYICTHCGQYVGFNHSLFDRQKECLLGSEYE